MTICNEFFWTAQWTNITFSQFTSGNCIILFWCKPRLQGAQFFSVGLAWYQQNHRWSALNPSHKFSTMFEFYAVYNMMGKNAIQTFMDSDYNRSALRTYKQFIVVVDCILSSLVQLAISYILQIAMQYLFLLRNVFHRTQRILWQILQFYLLECASRVHSIDHSYVRIIYVLPVCIIKI